MKVINIKNGVIKEVKKSLVGDYIGTGDFRIYEEKEIFKNKINIEPKINKDKIVVKKEEN